MQSKLNPYISFNGKAREAMEFYKTVFGGNLDLTTMKDGGASNDPATENNIMHGMLVADNGITIMGADAMGNASYSIGTAISISLSGDNENELTDYYTKLAEDGNIVEPLKKAPWGDTFGMLTDKFSIFWMVNISGQQPQSKQ